MAFDLYSSIGLTGNNRTCLNNRNGNEGNYENCPQKLSCSNVIKKIENGDNDRVEKLSYWKSDSSKPLSTLTVGKLVKNAASNFADRIAVSIYQGRRLTYAQVEEQTNILAAAFVALGLEKNDRIAIFGFNSIEWYLSFLAANKAGLVVVSLNPRLEAPELESYLSLSEPKALILDGQTENDRSPYKVLSSIIPEIEHSNYETCIRTKALPFLETVIVISENNHRGTYKWKNLFEIPQEEHKSKIIYLQSTIDVFDDCSLQFTSGTTSQPKGVLLTHHNIVNNAFLTAKNYLYNEKWHRSCVLIPFFHAYGMTAAILGCICYGASLNIPSVKYNSTLAIQCIIDEKCTAVYGTPTMYVDLLSIVSKRLEDGHPEIISKMNNLEIIITGGAIFLSEMGNKLKKYFPFARIASGYGMTELSPVTLLLSPHEPPEMLFKSVGRLLDHMEMKVVDENRIIVPLGTPGEMCFRGHMVTKSYYKNPQKTKEVIDEEGWFYSGDRFVMLENGYTQIVGRIKDTIIRGGENIEPTDIEEVIIKLPDIVDVQVYGVSDERLGETVAASIIKKENSNVSENDIRNFCNGKIAQYKIPKYIVFCKNYPKTVTGKIQKFKLRSALEEELRLNKS